MNQRCAGTMGTVILVAACEEISIIPGPRMPVDGSRPPKRGKPEKVYLTVGERPAIHSKPPLWKGAALVTGLRHAVLGGSGREVLLSPVFEQGLDVLRLQRAVIHPPKAEGMELIGDQGELKNGHPCFGGPEVVMGLHQGLEAFLFMRCNGL